MSHQMCLGKKRAQLVFFSDSNSEGIAFPVQCWVPRFSILDSTWLLSLLYLQEYSENSLDKIYNVAINYLNESVRNTSQAGHSVSYL